jgi:tetratricopeptide (TPR) repeat protein
MKVFRFGLLSVCVLAIAWLGGARLGDAWQWNWINLRLIKSQDAALSDTIPGCSHIWLVGMAVGQRGDRSAQHQAFVQALGCSPVYLSLVQAVLPADPELARLAAQHYPESSKAWFWLGEASAPTDPLLARHAYLATVALSPHKGLAWCRLGLNYVQNSEIEKASEAWLNCCLNGDPGSNGCYGAGLMMEQLGNLPQAIAYYRLSHWEGALKRAQELEASLKP